MSKLEDLAAKVEQAKNNEEDEKEAFDSVTNMRNIGYLLVVVSFVATLSIGVVSIMGLHPLLGASIPIAVASAILGGIFLFNAYENKWTKDSASHGTQAQLAISNYAFHKLAYNKAKRVTSAAEAAFNAAALESFSKGAT